MSFESIVFQWVQILCGLGFAFFFAKLHLKHPLSSLHRVGFYLTALALLYLTVKLQSPIYGLMGALLLCFDHHRKYGGGLLDSGALSILRIIGAESLVIVISLLLFILSQYELGGVFALVGMAVSASFHTHEESRGLEGDIEFPMVMPMAGLLLWSLLGNTTVNPGLVMGIVLLVGFLIVIDVRGFYERKAERDQTIQKMMESLK